MRTTECAFLIASVVAVAIGCTTTDRSRPTAPGDRDYPAINPKPEHIVEFEGTVPPTITMRLIGVWQAANTECAWPGPFSAPPKGYWIELPIALERQGDRVHGSTAIDHFQLGQCRWHLEGIRRSVGKDGSFGLLDYLATPSYSLHSDPSAPPVIIRCLFMKGRRATVPAGQEEYLSHDPCPPSPLGQDRTRASLTVEAKQRVEFVVIDMGQ